MDDYDDFQDFQDVQGLLQHMDEARQIGLPPVREARILWDRTNPLINISDTEFR
jgi:hypothetical protein